MSNESDNNFAAIAEAYDDQSIFSSVRLFSKRRKLSNLFPFAPCRDFEMIHLAIFFISAFAGGIAGAFIASVLTGGLKHLFE